MNLKNIIDRIQIMNPEAYIRIDKDGKKIYSSRDVKKLKLPNGFVPDAKKGIIVPGTAFVLGVEKTKGADAKRFIPLIDSLPDIKDTTNHYLLAWEIKKLNSDKEVGIDDPALGTTENIYLSSATDLTIPKGFYYNKKNGITNKHKTTSGAYITTKLRKINNNTHLILDDNDIEEKKTLADTIIGKKVMQKATSVADFTRRQKNIVSAFATALFYPNDPNNYQKEKKPKQKIK